MFSWLVLQVSHNLCILQNCLSSMMGKPITMDQLRQDVGVMVEKITHVTLMFRRLKLRMEEYVCLKVIIMLTQSAYYAWIILFVAVFFLHLVFDLTSQITAALPTSWKPSKRGTRRV